MEWILTTKEEEREREREQEMGEWWEREREREDARKRVKGSTRQNINLYVNRTKAWGLGAALAVMLVGGDRKASRGGHPY